MTNTVLLSETPIKRKNYNHSLNFNKRNSITKKDSLIVDLSKQSGYSTNQSKLNFYNLFKSIAQVEITRLDEHKSLKINHFDNISVVDISSYLSKCESVSDIFKEDILYNDMNKSLMAIEFNKDQRHALLRTEETENANDVESMNSDIVNNDIVKYNKDNVEVCVKKLEKIIGMCENKLSGNGEIDEGNRKVSVKFDEENIAKTDFGDGNEENVEEFNEDIRELKINSLKESVCKVKEYSEDNLNDVNIEKINKSNLKEQNDLNVYNIIESNKDNVKYDIKELNEEPVKEINKSNIKDLNKNEVLSENYINNVNRLIAEKEKNERNGVKNYKIDLNRKCTESFTCNGESTLEKLRGDKENENEFYKSPVLVLRSRTIKKRTKIDETKKHNSSRMNSSLETSKVNEVECIDLTESQNEVCIFFTFLNVT